MSYSYSLRCFHVNAAGVIEKPRQKTLKQNLIINKLISLVVRFMHHILGP